MASPTKQTKIRRVLKKVGRANQRKNDERNHGTTVLNLPLTKPNANELKQKATQKAAKKA
jgi:hypothetical protein